VLTEVGKTWELGRIAKVPNTNIKGRSSLIGSRITGDEMIIKRRSSVVSE